MTGSNTPIQAGGTTGEPDIDWSQLKALVIDDQALSREIIVTFLHELQLKGVRSCNSGPEALERLKRGDIDFIVCDMVMEPMNGLEFTRHIRLDPHLNGIPILMLTGEASESTVRNAMKAGVNDYVLKPVSFDDLKVRLEGMLGSKETANRPAVAEGGAA